MTPKVTDEELVREAERLFPNIFERAQYVKELKHNSLESGCDAYLYFQKLLDEALEEGVQLSKNLQAERERAEKNNIRYSSCEYTSKEMHVMHADYQASLMRENDLRAKLSVALEALQWAGEFFRTRDVMNSKIHCAPLRLSEITIRIDQALFKIRGGEK